MSYSRDLDEYSDEELREELGRRAKLAKKGRCTYCKRPVTASHCRFPERHTFKKGKKTSDDEPRIIVGDSIYTLTQALCEGALAHWNQVPYTCNPYDDEDDRAWDWNNGHELVDDEEAEASGFTRKKVEKALVAAKKRRL